MPEELFLEAKQKLSEVLVFLEKELAVMRVGRATPSLIENIEVEAYGTKMKLIELATIHAPQPQVLIVTPFDLNNLQVILTAIQKGNLGLTPVVDNNIIRITIPALTSERREEIIKLLHIKLEGARISSRQIRRDYMEKINKEAANSEDEQKRLQKELQEEVDKIIGEIEVVGENKEKELMTV